MSLNDIDRKALRRKVEKDVQQQKSLARAIFFVVNLLIYVLFMIIGWGMFLEAGGATIVPTIPGADSDAFLGAMIMLSVAGGLGVLFQFISLLLETRMGESQMRARIMAQVLGEQLLGMDEDEDAETEKEKRTMRLSDDGELEEIAEDAIVDEVPQAKQRR